MNDAQSVYLLLRKLLSEKKMTATRMCSDLNIRENTMSNMKRGSMPSADKLALIADYLNVSVEYLLGLSQNPTPPGLKPTPEHIRLMLADVHNLSDVGIERITEMIELVKLKEMNERNATIRNDIEAKE